MAAVRDEAITLSTVTDVVDYRDALARTAHTLPRESSFLTSFPSFSLYFFLRSVFI